MKEICASVFPTRDFTSKLLNSLHNGGPNHMETSSLICRANQWTGFYMIGTTFMKELEEIETSLNVENFMVFYNQNVNTIKFLCKLIYFN